MSPGMMEDPEPMQIDLVGDDMNDNSEDTFRPFVPLDIPEDTDFIVENPTLDLESYANSYVGLARLHRLLHIADHCPSLRLDALKIALGHVTKTMNVEMYQQIHKKIRGNAVLPVPSSSGGGPPDVANQNEAAGVGVGGADGTDFPPIDSQWMEQTLKRTAITLDKLDTDLKNYKANSIKESIRRGYDDIGEFYLECGDLINALKSFTRSRDYCTSAKHVINMCLNIIKVSIYMNNWSTVTNYVQKAEGTPDPSDDKKSNAKDVAQTSSRLRCAAGLAKLSATDYKTAATLFLRISFEHFEYPELLSHSNVAVYAALCALATFTRQELREQVIASGAFKPFLELEPPIREVINSFYEAKYGKCLQLLDEMKDNLLLDMYLAPHIRSLYNQIRSRGLVQYFAPYASADMYRMAQSFNTSIPQLENELMSLILAGQIQGRIDSQNKILFIKNEDERSGIFEKALKLGEDYERKTKLMILRSAMLKAQIQVKSVTREESSQSSRGSGRIQQNNHV